MRMRAVQNLSSKTTLSMGRIWFTLGGFACGALIVVVIILHNVLGIQHDSLASDVYSIKYPFDISDSKLKNVDFTVLGESVNTQYDEVRPMISGDEKTLFFSRRRYPGNISGEKDKQDIWLSRLQENGVWSEPQNLGIKINTKRADAICSVNQDGTEIVIFDDELNPSRLLAKSHLTQNGWSAPEPIEIEKFYNNERYVDFYYSFESNVILMAIKREDSKGGQDLYVSKLKGNNKWSAPESLGAVVNSEHSDFAPFLSADGKNLYFASYRQNGFGGCDIYHCVRLDDSWKNWSQPQNLGEGINSDREESYFSISGDGAHIYFESYDLKKEVRDIFRANIPEEFKSLSLPNSTIADSDTPGSLLYR